MTDAPEDIHPPRGGFVLSPPVSMDPDVLTQLINEVSKTARAAALQEAEAVVLEQLAQHKAMVSGTRNAGSLHHHYMKIHAAIQSLIDKEAL